MDTSVSENAHRLSASLKQPMIIRDQKNRVINARVTDQQYRLMKITAAEMGMTVTQLLLRGLITALNSDNRAG